MIKFLTRSPAAYFWQTLHCKKMQKWLSFFCCRKYLMKQLQVSLSPSLLHKHIQFITHIRIHFNGKLRFLFGLVLSLLLLTKMKCTSFMKNFNYFLWHLTFIGSTLFTFEFSKKVKRELLNYEDAAFSIKKVRTLGGNSQNFLGKFVRFF